MKKLLFLTFALFSGLAHAQYYTEHHIAPAPWQYWSTANEIVIGTLSATAIDVQVSKSDGTPLTVLSVSLDNPVSYRFVGNASAGDRSRNLIDQTYTDRGLVITSEEPVLVNVRNIASDATFLTTNTIKGNASLVSFGKEGLGREFRLGYYRQSTTGLFGNNVVYSVMAVEDETTVTLPTQPQATVVVLNTGESRLFHAPIGALLTADKSVVMNVGSWGDTPRTCGSNGEDGTFDQIAPVHVLGNQYLVVRGDGKAPTANEANSFFGSEQSLIVATENNTTIQIQNFLLNGTPFGTTTTLTLANAGDFHSFYHGDGQNKFSVSLINSNKPVIVYAGTAVECETDISTVLPIGSCAGSTNIQTKKFIDYNNNNLPYFGFTVIESPTIPVMMGGNNLEAITGNNRVALGTSGFYVITFDNRQLGNPENILLSSTMPLTSSLVQQGDGFSMSAFFSAFGEVALSPVIVNENENCTITLEAQIADDIQSYEWFLDGTSLGVTDQNEFTVTQSGPYTVRVLKDCGWGNISLPTEVEVNPCSDLKITKAVDQIEDGVVVFKITVQNLDQIFTDYNIEIQEILPSGYEFLETIVSAGTFDLITMTWNLAELEAGATETLLLKAAIIPNGKYVNKVRIKGTNRDFNLANNEATATIPLDLISFTMEAVEKEFHDIDELITYELILKNIGQNALGVINIEGTDLIQIVPNRITGLEPGEEVAISAQYRITLEDYQLGEVHNQAIALVESIVGIVDIKSDDPTTAAPQDPTITSLNRLAQVDVIKDNKQIFYKPGSTTDYEIVITNQGPTTALDLMVSDFVPEGIEVMTWKTSSDLSGSGDIQFHLPVFRVNESLIINSTVVIPADYNGDLINEVTLTSSIDDGDFICTRCIDMDIEDVIIPKGISPNGDGKNDYLDLSRFHVANLTVFNRYGVAIYSKDNYSTEWMGQTNGGSVVPTGVYFYKVLITSGDLFTGWIYVNY